MSIHRLMSNEKAVKCTEGFDSSVKESVIMKSAGKCLELEDILLSEVALKAKDKL